LLIKSPPASGKSRVLIFIALAKLANQGLKQTIIVVPQAYITDVIEKIASGWPASRWDELMPWNWTAAPVPVSRAA